MRTKALRIITTVETTKRITITAIELVLHPAYVQKLTFSLHAGSIIIIIMISTRNITILGHVLALVPVGLLILVLVLLLER